MEAHTSTLHVEERGFHAAGLALCGALVRVFGHTGQCQIATFTMGMRPSSGQAYVHFKRLKELFLFPPAGRWALLPQTTAEKPIKKHVFSQLLTRRIYTSVSRREEKNGQCQEGGRVRRKIALCTFRVV